MLDASPFRESFAFHSGGDQINDEPCYCLAIRVLRRGFNDLDTDELEAFLNGAAGPRQWLVMSEWLFSAPVPACRPGLILMPVLTSPDAAQRLRLSECEDRQPRLFGQHGVDAQELSNWRWLAAQVYPRADGRGVFPWEQEAVHVA